MFVFIMGAQTSYSSYPPEAELEPETELEDDMLDSPSRADSSPIQGRVLKPDLDDATFVNSPSEITKTSPLRRRMIEPPAVTPSGDRERNGTLVGNMKERYLENIYSRMKIL